MERNKANDGKEKSTVYEDHWLKKIIGYLLLRRWDRDTFPVSPKFN